MSRFLGGVAVGIPIGATLMYGFLFWTLSAGDEGPVSRTVPKDDRPPFEELEGAVHTRPPRALLLRR